MREGEGELEVAVCHLDEDAACMEDVTAEESKGPSDMDDAMTGADDGARVSGSVTSDVLGCQFFGFPLFEGISTYKQRRKKGGSVGASGGVLPKPHKDSKEWEPGSGRDRYPSSSAGNGVSRERHSQFGSLRAQSGAAMSAAENFLKQARGETVPVERKLRVQSMVNMGIWVCTTREDKRSGNSLVGSTRYEDVVKMIRLIDRRTRRHSTWLHSSPTRATSLTIDLRRTSI